MQKKYVIVQIEQVRDNSNIIPYWDFDFKKINDESVFHTLEEAELSLDDIIKKHKGRNGHFSILTIYS